MKFNYSFLFILPFFLMLLPDNMFIELTAPNNPDAMAKNLNLIIKATAGISFIYSLYSFKRMSSVMRVAFVLLCVYLFALIFESKYFYNTYMVYPHVFQKVLLYYNIFFIYTFYKEHVLKLSHLVYIILVVFILNVIIINPHTLSVSSFTNNDRGVWSSSIYMLVFPFFYFISKYFYKGGMYNLFMAFATLFCIFFYQHRTVWITTAVMIIVYYLLIRFKAHKKINYYAKLAPVATVMLVLSIVASSFIFTQYPEIVEKIQASFSDIENYDSQGTGGWRMNQIMSYIPFVEDNFLLGMRFEGFELPIQFYRDDIDAPVFEDGKGHFFHSFYLEVFFYMGLVGMVLFLIPTLYALIKGFKMNVLTTNQIILYSFVCSGFIFGLSYVVPPFYYAGVGLCIAILEKESEDSYSFLSGFVDRVRLRRQAQKGQLIS